MKHILITALALFTSAIVQAQEVIFHYTFNENISDTANNLTLEPVSTYSLTEGKYGNALELDGSGQYLDLKTENLNDPAANEYTICAWVYNLSGEIGIDYTEEIILAQLNGSADNPKRGRIQLYTQKRFDRMAYATWVGGGERFGSINSHQDSVWQHVALVFHPVTRAIDFYVDGIFDTTFISGNDFETCTGGYRVGGHKNGSSGFWKGKIDELFLLKGALTVDQINEIKNNTWDNYVTKVLLRNTISIVQEFLSGAETGSNPGEYPVGLINTLNDTLQQAIIINDSIGVVQSDIDTIQKHLEDYYNFVLNEVVKASATVNINSGAGHAITEGLSGYNMRISDGPWNYDHPDFREAAKSQTPGFFRYFSGTRNDYMDHNTGMYELQWHQQVDSETSGHTSSLPWSDYKFIEGKGPHTIYRLNDMCGELGTKIVVTWNGFVCGPDDARNFALFCKNNNIIVESWQFVNEPNFYTPTRRYFWNNGGDFAFKMKEIGMAIREVYPDADLSPSYGWDGFGSFATSIKEYQDSDTAWWNTVSYHSYAIHGKGSDFASARAEANRMLNVKTNNNFFNLVESRSWNDAKIMLTEVGTWNDHVKNKVYSAIYMGEYFMRLSNHPQTFLVGRHHIADAVKPSKNNRDTIFHAFENNYDINENQLPTGWYTSMEGQAHSIINKAINNSKYVFELSLNNDITVPDNIDNTTKALYTVAYKGIDSLDYLLVTNKSSIHHNLDISISGVSLNKMLYREYMYSYNPEDKVLKIYRDTVNAADLVIPPYCVMRIEYQKDSIEIPEAPRLYRITHNNGEVNLKWWKRSSATSYKVQYGTSPGMYSQNEIVDTNYATISDLTGATTYYFAVSAVNAAGESQVSNEVSAHTAVPGKPSINYVFEDYNRITIHWESVPYANGYKVKYGNSTGTYTDEHDAGNVSGYVLRWLPTDSDFYIVVEAYNGYGSGEVSDEIEASTMSKRPWAPFLLKAFEKTNGDVQLSWAEPDSLHGGTYNLYYCPTPWNEDNYELIASGIESPMYVDATPRSNGKHLYRVKAENDVAESFFYSNISTVFKNIDNSVGTITVHNDGKTVIYPNPATNKIIVQTDQSTIESLITMYNLSGQVVKEFQHNLHTEIPTGELSRGMYLIEIKTSNSKYIEKIVLE